MQTSPGPEVPSGQTSYGCEVVSRRIGSKGMRIGLALLDTSELQNPNVLGADKG